jgi:TPR repeat protein
LKWYRKSADQEFALGQYLLGLFDLYGRGGSVDRPAAIFWLKKAAAQNNQASKDKLRELGETP